MRVVITGATGNVGTSLVRALGADERVTEAVGVARRIPEWQPPHTTWFAADVAEAMRTALLCDCRGAYNLAAEDGLGERTRWTATTIGLLTMAASASWRIRLQPVHPGWLRLAGDVPLLSCARAERELGWRPRHSAHETVQELLHGLRDDASEPTPPLQEGR